MSPRRYVVAPSVFGGFKVYRLTKSEAEPEGTIWRGSDYGNALRALHEAAMARRTASGRRHLAELERQP